MFTVCLIFFCVCRIVLFADSKLLSGRFYYGSIFLGAKLPTFSDCVIKEERMAECQIKAGNQGVDFNGRLRKEKCGFKR